MITYDKLEPDLHPIQRKFRELRNACGWSLSEASRRLGLPGATLGTYERGDRIPSILVADDVFRGYGWQLDTVRVAEGPGVWLPPDSAKVLRSIADDIERKGQSFTEQPALDWDSKSLQVSIKA